MDNKQHGATDLDEFLKAELAGVDLESVHLEAVVTPYWRWGFQPKLRAISDYGPDLPTPVVAE
jgi:hypothetical protein